MHFFKKHIDNYILFSLFLLYSFLLFFFCSKFSPLYDFNEWSDINIYYTIGKGIFFDKVIYKDLFDHKGPIIFFIYALGYVISPNSFLGLFLIESVLFSFALFFIYLTSKLFVNSSLSFCVALASPLAFFSFSWLGGCAEEFVVIFECISLYFFLKYFTDSELRHSLLFMFLHGILLGIVFFIKLNLIVFWLPPLLFIFIILLKNKLYKCFIYNVLFLFLGFIFVLSILLFYFGFNFAINDFWNAYFYFNSQYGGIGINSFQEIFLRIGKRGIHLCKSIYIELFLIVISIFYFTFCHNFKHKLGRFFFLGSLICSLFLIFIGQVFMDYYYVGLSIYVIPGLLVVAILIDKYLNIEGYLGYLLILFSFVSCYSLAITHQNFFGFTRDTLITRNFPKTFETILADEINLVKNPTLLCLSANRSINLFTKCSIVPNVKYFFRPNNIVRNSKFYFIAEEQMGYIRNRLIDFVILVDANSEFLDNERVLLESGYKLVKETNDAGFNYLLFKKD